MKLLKALTRIGNPNKAEYYRRKSLFSDALERSSENIIHKNLREERKKEIKSRSRSKRTLAGIDASLGCFVVGDCETSGLKPDSHRVIELSAIRFDIDGNELERFSSLLKYRGKIPNKVRQITGITDEEIRKSGRPGSEVFGEFYDFVGEAPIFFHNAPFDEAFIQNNAMRVLDSSCVQELDAYCTLEMSQQILNHLSDHKLKTLAKYVKSPNKPSHRGLSDALVTKDVLMHLRRKSLGV